MLLTIDVGNTNTVLGTFLGEDLVHSWRVKTDPRSTADELWLQMRALVEGIDITGYLSALLFRQHFAKCVR